MNLKLYSRPYSGRSLNSSKFVTPHSPTGLSHRILNFTSEQFTLESARLPNYTSPDNYPEDTLRYQEDYQKFPEDSQYNLNCPFPDRPKSSHLSGLTLKENERTSAQNRTLTKLYQKKSARLFSANNLLSMPTEQDFSKILTKLEMVSSNRTAGTRKMIVNEGDNLEIMLEAGLTQYFIVNCRGKKPPMVGFVKVNKGKVVNYVSKVHSEPSKDICELSSKAEVFQVKDVSLKFKFDVIYIGVEALLDSVFNISVTFGQNVTMKLRKSLRIDKEEKEVVVRPYGDIDLKKKKKIVFKKDFLQINIEKSKKALGKDEGLRKTWEFKRESAQKRKKIILLNKQQRTINLLNRKYRTHESFFKIPLETRRFWMGLLVFQKTVEFLNALRR